MRLEFIVIPLILIIVLRRRRAVQFAGDGVDCALEVYKKNI